MTCRTRPCKYLLSNSSLRINKSSKLSTIRESPGGEEFSAQKSRNAGDPLGPLRQSKKLFGINPSTLPVSDPQGHFREGREEGKIRRSKTLSR